MVLAGAAIVGGLALLWVGAEGLVRGAGSLALRLGLTPLVVGLTVVAFGTSAPELIVAVSASLRGETEIAIGNVVGANIGNIGWILGLGALIRPIAVRAQLIRIDLPIMVASAILFSFFAIDGEISRIEGAFLATGIIAYTVMALRMARRPDSRTLQRELRREVPAKSGSAARDVLLAAGGFVLLLCGANLLVNGAVVVARVAGLDETVIGITVVALGTTLPELAATLAASAKGAGDLAVGNVVGSNIFNGLAVIGLAALTRPLDASEVRLADLVIMILFAVAVLPLARRKERLDRGEGAALLVCYVAYIATLVAFS